MGHYDTELNTEIRRLKELHPGEVILSGQTETGWFAFYERLLTHELKYVKHQLQWVPLSQAAAKAKIKRYLDLMQARKGVKR